MHGGLVVQDEDEAAEISAMYDRPVEVGEEVTEEPCVQEWQLELYRKRAKHPQPCPRPALQLHEDNQVAWSYLQLLLGDITRPAAEGLLLDSVRSSAERVRIRLRAAAVMVDPEVSALLWPKAKGEEEEAAGEAADRNER